MAKRLQHDLPTSRRQNSKLPRDFKLSQMSYRSMKSSIVTALRATSSNELSLSQYNLSQHVRPSCCHACGPCAPPRCNIAKFVSKLGGGKKETMNQERRRNRIIFSFNFLLKQNIKMKLKCCTVWKCF